MTAAFDKAFEITVGFEGGYDANPKDPGNYTGGAVGRGTLGGTKYGIASAGYADNLAKLPASVRDGFPAAVKDLTVDQAKTLYRANYWDAVCGDDLPTPLAVLVWDAAVNNSVSRAAKWLQAAVDAEIDGQIGPATL